MAKSSPLNLFILKSIYNLICYKVCQIQAMDVTRECVSCWRLAEIALAMKKMCGNVTSKETCKSLYMQAHEGKNANLKMNFPSNDDEKE